MAPEMLRGNKYDEKVDIFSFGIIMCEIIGRVQADPDFIPRNDDFGLNRQQFFDTFCLNQVDPCPEIFYKIAFLCCNLNPDKRPSFKTLQEWFDRICVHCAILGSFHTQLPADLVSEISFYGEDGTSSSCNTLSYKSESQIFKLLEPTSISADSVIDAETKPSDIMQRSPHLAKDFNANGDRIRRKLKIRENRLRVIKKENGTEASETVHSKKNSPTKHNDKSKV